MDKILFPVLRKIFSQFTWEINTPNKNIYLTFDDGPEPGVTPQVLSFLKQYNAKATFFCLGSKLELYPDIKSLILKNEHTIGNHGYLHLDGFKSSTKTYVDNIRKGADITKNNLFRPPYGRITPWQFNKIKSDTRIIMWSIMSMDYSNNSTIEKCIRNVLNNAYPGAIILFHDSIKASKIVLNALPIILETLSHDGYSFRTIC